jgi:small nuclear ribonucleoprotein (snRNP)-like protein
MQKRSLRHLLDKRVWVKVFDKTEYYGVLVGEDYNQIYVRLEKIKIGRYERDVNTNMILLKSIIDDVLLDCSGGRK